MNGHTNSSNNSVLVLAAPPLCKIDNGNFTRCHFVGWVGLVRVRVRQAGETQSLLLRCSKRTKTADKTDKRGRSVDRSVG
jgi:hypothetical protein